MLTRTQLGDIHREDVPLHLLELDYIQSIFLKHTFMKNDNLVFKGGTALRKVHGLDRFSEDLDFNIIKGEPDLDVGLRGLERTGIEAEISHFDERDNVYLAKVRYQGPLYSGNELSKGSLQIDISKHKVHNEPRWQTLTERYPDVGTYSVMIMDEEEILAEKFRSLVQRRMPRDIYDVWFLLKKGTRIRYGLIEKKFYDLDIKIKDPENIIEDYDLSSEEWERDMSNLVNRVPNKDRILKDIKSHIDSSRS